MVVLKVLHYAVLFSILFAMAGMPLINWLEASVGKAAPVVITGIGCVGMLLGGIAGAAEAVVTAVTAQKPPPG